MMEVYLIAGRIEGGRRLMAKSFEEELVPLEEVEEWVSL